MIARYALRVVSRFGRLNKPKLNKIENVFELMRDRSTELKFIQTTNNLVLNTTKFMKPEEQLSSSLGISTKISKEVLNTVLKMNAYSPIWIKPYRVHQKINGDVEIDESNENVEAPYHPSHLNLKFHYSINKDIPLIEEYKQDKATAYIFNLPEQIDQKSLLMELGYRLIKNIKIYYCMLGLPAYAEVQFNSENALTEKMMSGQTNVKIGDRDCTLKAIKDDQTKFSLERRQIVIKGLGPEETPASMLKKLSAYGKVMHIDLPLQIHRQPSLEQVKQMYKNERSPIQINYHRQNGTIQSEYYPPLQKLSSVSISNLQAKQEQYKRRLRYCENVDVYEGKAGEVRTRSRGFCMVTYSCQEQAQNCYLQIRNTTRVELLQNKYEFQFDDKHREALLRFIDNSYIQRCLDNNPTKQFDEQQKKHNSIFFQSLFLETIYSQYRSQIYYNLPKFIRKNANQQPDYDAQHRYRQYLSLFKNSIGVGNINETNNDNQYGKSFDQLAEQQLYGMKLKQKSQKPRYQVNIDDYIRETVDIPKKKERGRKKKEIISENSDQILLQQQNIQDEKQLQQEQAKQALQNAKKAAESDEVQKAQKQQQKQLNQSPPPVQKVLPAHGKKKFSTAKIQQRYFRPKQMSQKIKAHIAYNRFIRDTINQYMGIFPIDKMQSEIYRKKLTFVNPQGLRLEDGTEFITEDDVKRVLQYSTNMQHAQDFYNDFIRANQIAKSTNADIEERVMKDFQDNVSQMLYQYTDVGVVKEEIKYQGNQIEKVVQQLNMEAEFGEEYKIIQDEETKAKRIVKVAKLENIYPIEAIQKIKKQTNNFKKSKEFDSNKLALVLKYKDYFTNGQPVPDQFAQAFGLQKNEVIDLAKLSQQMCLKLSMNKKDMQKYLNMQNYTPEQLGADYEKQKQLLNARKRRSPKKATDYGRDPSQIKTRDKDNKAVVSKFRQI